MFLTRILSTGLILCAFGATTVFADDVGQRRDAISDRDVLSTCNVAPSVRTVATGACGEGSSQIVNFDLQAIGYASNNDYSIRVQIIDAATKKTVYDGFDSSNAGVDASSDSSGKLYGYNANQLDFSISSGSYVVNIEVYNVSISPSDIACQAKASFTVQ